MKRDQRRSAKARLRTGTVAAILAVSLSVTACTQAEIEGSLGRIAISFEQGGPESALSEALFIGEQAAFVVGMRLGGLGFP